jgi:membrane fusion protein (multidrug efflux system)
VPVGPLDTVVGVPVNALRKGPQGDHVFVIEPDSANKPRAHVRTVQSGPVLGEEVIVYDGVKSGEQIATSGSFKLREGVLVAIADPGRQADAGQPSDSAQQADSSRKE